MHAILYSRNEQMRQKCSVAGKNGTRFGYRDAVCLETQYYPDSPAHEDFPSVVLKKGETYAHETKYGFFVKGSTGRFTRYERKVYR